MSDLKTTAKKLMPKSILGLYHTARYGGPIQSRRAFPKTADELKTSDIYNRYSDKVYGTFGTPLELPRILNT